MSSAIPISDVASVLIRSEVAGKSVELCLWFRSNNPPVTQSKLDLIASRVSVLWNINFSNVLGGPHLLKEVIAIDRSPGSSLTSVVSVNLSKGFGGTPAPTSIALGLLNLTDENVRGHFSMSRVYAVPIAQVAENFVESSYASGLLALWSTNNQSHGPFGWHHVYVSQFLNGTPRSTGLSLRVTHYALAGLVVRPRRYRLLGRPR